MKVSINYGLDSETQKSRTNAQMIHIHQTYGTCLKSSRLHNQLLQTFGILLVTLQQNDCKSFTFSIMLWPRLKVKVIQTETMLWEFSRV